MSELMSHGTGWSESESLMDVIEIYNAWNGEDAPDFSPLQRRLREKFTDDELTTLETVVDTLHKFINADLTRRVLERN